jgi:hypothetical protein
MASLRRLGDPTLSRSALWHAFTGVLDRLAVAASFLIGPMLISILCALERPVLSGFNRRAAAEASVRFNGFYLFEAGLIEPNWITIPCTSGQQDAVDGALPLVPHVAAFSSVPRQGSGRPENASLISEPRALN